MAGSWVLVLLHAVWTRFHWGGEDRVALINDLTNVVLGLALVVVTWRASTAPGADRSALRGWRLIALGSFGYWMGNVLWFRYEVLLEVKPFPSLADLGYLSFSPLVLAGLLCFIAPLNNRTERLQLWLDVAMVVVGVGTLVWFFLLYPIAQAHYNSPLELALTQAYPVGDTVLLFGVVALLLKRRPGQAAAPMAWLVAGLLSHFAADSLFAIQALQGTYLPGKVPDLLYNLAYLLMMVGPYLDYRLDGRRPAPQAADPPRVRDLRLLPYLAVVLAYGLLLFVARDQWDAPLGGLIVAAVVLTALVLARQMLSAREIARLRAEQATRATEARFESMVRNSSDVVSLLGPDLRIRFISPAVEPVFGHAPQALTDTPWLDLIHPDDQARARDYLADTLERGGSGPIAEWRLREDGGGAGGMWRASPPISPPTRR